MHRHRFLRPEDTVPPSGAAAPAPSASGFMVCPLALHQGLMGWPCAWLQVYQAAYAQAQAVARPSRLERLEWLLAASWN